MKTNAMVTIDNYEEYLMLAADGELDAAGSLALGVFMEEHPELEGEVAIWTSGKLQPDLSMVYPDQSTLLKKEPRIIPITWRGYSLAAAAAVVFAIVLIPRLTRHEVPEIAHKWTKTANPAVVSVSLADASAKLVAATPIFRKKAPQKGSLQVREQRRDITRTPIEAAELTAVYMLPVKASSARADAAKLQLAEAPATIPTVVAATDDANNEGGVHIRLAAANKSAVNLFKEGLERRVEQAKALTRSVKETAFAVRIGNKNHYLNF